MAEIADGLGANEVLAFDDEPAATGEGLPCRLPDRFVEEYYVMESVQEDPIDGQRRRKISGPFAGLAVITGVIALADLSSHSSYVLVQNLNPYFIGAFSIAAAVTAGALSSGRRSERWAAGMSRA